jgi:hypothetical protein
MERLKFCQLSIEIVLLAGRRRLRHYHNSTISTDLHPRDLHTGRGHGLNRPGHVLLPECGRSAGHVSYRETHLSGVIAHSAAERLKHPSC